jgi:hypothetical protein
MLDGGSDMPRVVYCITQYRASGTYRRISRATTWHADVKPAISWPAVRTIVKSQLQLPQCNIHGDLSAESPHELRKSTS